LYAHQDNDGRDVFIVCDESAVEAGRGTEIGQLIAVYELKEAGRVKAVIEPVKSRRTPRAVDKSH